MGVKYRHIRSNSVYEVLHFGYDEATMKPIVIYRNEDGIVFSRNMHIFFDGRFELVKSRGGPINIDVSMVRSKSTLSIERGE